MILPKRLKHKKRDTGRGPIRSDSHLRWIRGFECSIAGKRGHACQGKIQAAHVRTGTDGGGSSKPGDNWTIPLCAEAHAIQHSPKMGEPRFEAHYGIDMKAIASGLAARSPHLAKLRRAG